MTKEQLIEEARKRGIVPGAEVRTATVNGFVDRIGSTDKWRLGYNGVLWSDTNIALFDGPNQKWAEVVTHAPAEGLVNGMACEPDEHMRAAIVAKARVIGVADNMTHIQSELNPNVQWCGKNGLRGLGTKGHVGNYWHTLNFIPSGEFYDRLCRMEKPIKVGEHTVQFNPGSIKVGCTTIDNETVRAIAAKLKD